MEGDLPRDIIQRKRGLISSKKEGHVRGMTRKNNSSIFPVLMGIETETWGV